MKLFSCVIGSATLACLLAVVATTAGGAAAPSPVSLSVSLRATVTKDWNTVTEATEGDCEVSRRSIGKRTVTLRSTRPTTVVATFGPRGVSFSPPAVRFVAIRVEQSGERRTRTKAPCQVVTRRVRCPRARRAVGGGTFRFRRSGRNEISFYSSRLPDARSSCPPEPAAVRSIRPGLRDAQGTFSESALADSRRPSQTAFGSAELTTELEGAPAGVVVERIRWLLTFTRKP